MASSVIESAAEINCSISRVLEADPDVSGIGIALSFLVPSCFMLALIGTQFLLVSRKTQNLLDRAVWNVMVLKPFRVDNEGTLNRWTTSLESAVFAISDTQLTTSVAILVGGFIQLSRGVALYHWQTTVNLAWFSAITHLATLTLLKLSVRSRSSMATWRVLAMGAVLLLLSVAFVPTGYVWQRDYELSSGNSTDSVFTNPDNKAFNATMDSFSHLAASPAICWYSTRSRRQVEKQIAALAKIEIPPIDAGGGYRYFNGCLVGISIAYLLTSYLTRVTRLYAPLAKISDQWFRIVPLAVLQNWYRSAESKQRRSSHQKSHAYKTFAMLVVLLLAEAFYEVADSIIWEILWLGAALIWGALRLVALQSQFQVPAEDEGRWGFGQVLPLLLSIFPIWCSITESSDLHSSDLGQDATTFRTQEDRDFLIIQEIRQTLWFRSLTALILGKAIVVAAYILVEYPAATVSARTAALDTLRFYWT
ncbi:MAG: hypothetical protein LQ344_001073 [Seirophora lacunosa]|nr:MAG: hypothetical protein LQ344_001073 [Seirophora lacunosa]